MERRMKPRKIEFEECCRITIEATGEEKSYLAVMKDDQENELVVLSVFQAKTLAAWLNKYARWANNRINKP